MVLGDLDAAKRDAQQLIHECQAQIPQTEVAALLGGVPLTEARKLLAALAEVAQGRVPAAPPGARPAAPPPKPAQPAGVAAKKSIFRPASLPPPPKGGATTKPIPFPGRWKR